MATGLTQSVSRALSILTCFTDETPELRMTDISQRLDLTPSLVSRLLGTLEHDGFVEQDSATGMYRLGRAILTLSGVTLNHNRAAQRGPQRNAVCLTAGQSRRQPIGAGRRQDHLLGAY
ncbi:MAG: helix-turn-helix domain-containing protein [Chloroflexi bacterium]|nr:helix-turn-helix domain-containing protein [Chloroflexota bacterium]